MGCALKWGRGLEWTSNISLMESNARLNKTTRVLSIFYIWFRDAFCSSLPLEKYLPKSTTWVKFETSVIPDSHICGKYELFQD